MQFKLHFKRNNRIHGRCLELLDAAAGASSHHTWQGFFFHEDFSSLDLVFYRLLRTIVDIITYMRDPTVQKFLEETTLDPPVAGKVQRINLAGPSKVLPKSRAASLCGGSHGPATPRTPADQATLPDPQWWFWWYLQIFPSNWPDFFRGST